MDLALPVEPMTCEEKDRLAGVTEAAGAVPVPVSAMAWVAPRLKCAAPRHEWSFRSGMQLYVGGNAPEPTLKGKRLAEYKTEL